jgi:hypothetical protein
LTKFQGAAVSKNLPLADIVTKVLWFSLGIGGVVFVLMLLLTRLHA